MVTPLKKLTLALACLCSLGAAANVGVGAWVYEINAVWWLAGLAGVVMGSVWNYALSSVFVWGRK